MFKNLKLKKQVKRNLIIGVLLIIISVTGVKLYNNYLYKQTYEYKFLEKKYSITETKILIDNFKDSKLDKLLKLKYNPNITKFVTSKYFLMKNFDTYLNYYEKNNSLNISKVISLVNVGRNKDFYENNLSTDVSKKHLMLVNKYNFLDKKYVPENLTTTTGTYSYENNSLIKEAYDGFIELADAAKVDGHTILMVSSYRDYNYQDEIWNNRKSLHGTRADDYAARAGHSEHQTGYSIDVADFYDVNDKFGETDSFLWIAENSYKYGFILRYPKDKEDITGYSYEPWHYRYVGKETANKIFKDNITFDEYYTFYLDK